MYDPLNPNTQEVDPKEGLKGLLACSGYLAAVLIPVLLWLLWMLFFRPPPTSVALAPTSTDEPTTTPGPTFTLVFTGGELLRLMDLRFTKFQVAPPPSCLSQAEFQVTKGGKIVPCNALTRFEVWVNHQITQVTRQTSKTNNSSEDDTYVVTFSAVPICNKGGTVQVRSFVGADSVYRTYYWEPSQGSAKTPDQGLNRGSIQVLTESYPEIVVYFSMVDSKGNATRLNGFTTTRLYQDGAEVNDYSMTYVDSNVDPVTAALVLDTSGSMTGAPLTNARAAATNFINTLGPKDSACLYGFSTTVTQVQTCTTDKQAAVKSLNTLNAAGNTALYDVVSAVAADHAKRTGRQVVIALSDGADTASKGSMQDSLNRIKQTNIPLYTIGLINKDLNSNVLRQFATTTGATYLEAPNSTDLKNLYDQIQGQLKNQYMVKFRSIFPDRKSGTVTLRLANGDQSIDLSRPYFVK